MISKKKISFQLINNNVNDYNIITHIMNNLKNFTNYDFLYKQYKLFIQFLIHLKKHNNYELISIFHDFIKYIKYLKIIFYKMYKYKELNCELLLKLIHLEKKSFIDFIKDNYLSVYLDKNTIKYLILFLFHIL